MSLRASLVAVSLAFAALGCKPPAPVASQEKSFSQPLAYLKVERMFVALANGAVAPLPSLFDDFCVPIRPQPSALVPGDLVPEALPAADGSPVGVRIGGGQVVNGILAAQVSAGQISNNPALNAAPGLSLVAVGASYIQVQSAQLLPPNPALPPANYAAQNPAYAQPGYATGPCGVGYPSTAYAPGVPPAGYVPNGVAPVNL
jgi:hypothetical protein